MSENDDAAELELITECVAGIFKVLEKCESPDMVFQVLASSTAIALCAFTRSNDGASETFSTFQEAVGEAVQKAIDNNMTLWGEGTAH